MLFDAWREAFAGRDDVTLVLKDFGANDIYRDSGREPIREHIASGALPRVVLIDDGPLHRRGGRAVPRLRRARPSLPRRGLRHAGARGDGLRPARDRHRRRPHRRVPARRRRLADRRARGPTSPRTASTPWRRTGAPGSWSPTAPIWSRSCARPTAPTTASLRPVAAPVAPPRRASPGTRWPRATRTGSPRWPRAVPGPPTAAVHEPFPLEEEVALRVLATPAWRALGPPGRAAGRMGRGDHSRHERVPVPAGRSRRRRRARGPRGPHPVGGRGGRSRHRGRRGHQRADGAAPWPSATSASTPPWTPTFRCTTPAPATSAWPARPATPSCVWAADELATALTGRRHRRRGGWDAVLRPLPGSSR